ncbi:MAG: DUF5615 family PIN-like protein [Planctomycetota bacterium]
MRFIVDVNVGRRIANFLVQEGHDAVWVGDLGQELPDTAILEMGFRDRRVILTIDKDFENLAFRRRLPFFAIVRLPSEPYPQTRSRLTDLLREHANDISPGNVVCVTSAGVRVRHGSSKDKHKGAK